MATEDHCSGFAVGGSRCSERDAERDEASYVTAHPGINEGIKVPASKAIDP